MKKQQGGESDGAEGDEGEESKVRPNNTEGNGALQEDSAAAFSRSEMGKDRRGNDHSSITCKQRDKGEDRRAEGQLECRKEPQKGRPSINTAFTTLHPLPRSAAEQRRSIDGTLPRLLTRQESRSRVLAGAQSVSVLVLIKLM